MKSLIDNFEFCIKIYTTSFTLLFTTQLTYKAKQMAAVKLKSVKEWRFNMYSLPKAKAAWLTVYFIYPPLPTAHTPLPAYG